MNNLKRLLFKRSKPVLRRYEPITSEGAGDAPYLWDAYQKGLLKETPENMSMADFSEWLFDATDRIPELWIVEDYVKGKLEPVAFIYAIHDGWLMEPHVVHFDNASPRIILRTWVAFLNKTRFSKHTGACLIRVEQDSVNLANKLEQMKILHWVGKIWCGRPDGNEYLYSMRCKRVGAE